MGEITEALRRSRLEQEHRPSAAPEGRTADHHDESRDARVRLRLVPEPPPVDWAPPARHAPPPVDWAAPAHDLAPAPAPAPQLVRRERRRSQLRWPIARAKAGFWTARAVSVDPRGPSAECFRHFAVRVARELEARKSGTLLITSALAAEGKTVTACNLALALATLSAGRRIALVDLDLRRPSVARGMGIAPQVGLEQVLAGEAPLAAARVPTDQLGLDLFLVGRPSQNAHERLVGPRLSEVVGELARAYRIIVFDAPPVLPVPDVPLVLAHVDACVPVVRSGVTRRASFRQMLELLPREKLIGQFLNESPAARYARRHTHY